EQHKNNDEKIISSNWERPALGTIKCNYDAAFDPNLRRIVAGWIARNNQGVAQFWGSSNLRTAISALEAEGKALLCAMQSVWAMGFDSIIFQGDNESLAKIIEGQQEDISVLNLVDNIKNWKRKFTHIR
ncbi:hypothetical protein EUTSA_v10002256mg, partial [Eutrema salsugineum]